MKLETCNLQLATCKRQVRELLLSAALYLGCISAVSRLYLGRYASYYFQLRTLCQRENREFTLKPMEPSVAAALEARGIEPHTP